MHDLMTWYNDNINKKDINHVEFFLNKYRERLLSDTIKNTCISYYYNFEDDISNIKNDLKRLVSFGFFNIFICNEEDTCGYSKMDNQSRNIIKELGIYRKQYLKEETYVLPFDSNKKAWGIYENGNSEQGSLCFNKEHLYVTIEGDLYFCGPSSIFGERFKIGNVDTGYNLEKTEALVKESMPNNCLTCVYKMKCLRSCPVIIEQLGDKYNSIDFCNIQKEFLTEGK